MSSNDSVLHWEQRWAEAKLLRRVGADATGARRRLDLANLNVQTQLAKTTGIDQAEISRIERGASNATEDTLARLAKALDAELTIVQRTRAVA